MTLTELQTLRDGLISALAKGLTEVTSGDKTIRYQTTTEMRNALSALNNEIATVNGTAAARSIATTFSRD